MGRTESPVDIHPQLDLTVISLSLWHYTTMNSVPSSTLRPLIAVSSCLLGEQVRFDGGHKRDNWIIGPLGEFFDYRPICPEVAIGLGIPRPPIHLTGGQKKTVGIHTRVITQSLPNLPVEEEGRLNDPVLRENVVNRVLVYRRWQDFLRQDINAKGLVTFHAAHKYMVLAHSQAANKRLGRMLSDLKGRHLPEVAGEYIAELMAALQRRCNRDRHVNVLQHIMGYLKKRLDGEDKQELVESIEAYRRGEVPLIVPIFLLRHHFRHQPDPYMDSQWYLDPYPAALGLRNNI